MIFANEFPPVTAAEFDDWEAAVEAECVPVASPELLQRAWVALFRADDCPRLDCVRGRLLAEAAALLERAGRDDLAARIEAIRDNGGHDGGEVAEIMEEIRG